MNLLEFIEIYRRVFDKDTPGIGKKLAHKMREEIRLMNQPIHIRDLVAKADSQYSFGEAEPHTNSYPQPFIKRLKDHIKMLFDLANADHRVNFCEQDTEGRYKIKSGKENTVTRLSTPEFAFYTSGAPLSNDAFSELYEELLETTENRYFNLDENVHVLLSSFAVHDKSGHLLNLCLFIEGGNPLQVHVFSKNFASDIDINYGLDLFSQPYDVARSDNRSKDGMPLHTGQVIYTGSVFEVRTVGGAKFTQVTDVCIDHYFDHGKRQVLDILEGGAHEHDIIPESLEHCITSNTTELFSDACLSDQVLHADADNTVQLRVQNDVGRQADTEAGRITDRSMPLLSESYSTAITRNERGYFIDSPPFGSNLQIVAFPRRPVGKLTPDFLPKLQKHNYAVLAKRLNFLQIACNLEDSRAIKLILEDVRGKLNYHLNELEKTLLVLCEPGFLEELYASVEYGEKVAAGEIIQKAMEDIRASIDEKGGDAIEMIDKWKKELEKNLDKISLSGCVSDFIRQLKSEITRSLDVNLVEDMSSGYSGEMSI